MFLEHPFWVLFYLKGDFKLDNLQLPIVNEIKVTGRAERRLIDKQAKLWERISRWSKACDVECEDGKSVEEKLGSCTFSVKNDGVYVTYSTGGADTVTKKLGSVVKILALLEELESPSKSDSEEDICEAIKNLLIIWYRKGLSHSIGNENVKIKYTYHQHRTGDGSASSDTIYSYNSPGGCYKSAGHTHNKIGTCPSHEVETDCPLRGQGIKNFCIACGGSPGYDEKTGEQYMRHNKISTIVYDCDYRINTWTVQCGRQVGDIDKVEIIYWEPEEN